MVASVATPNPHFDRQSGSHAPSRLLPNVHFGPIQVLLDDPTVSEVMVNGPNLVYAERKGKLEKTDVKFRDNEHVREVIESDHQAARPADLREIADGRRPPAGRLTRQRRHSRRVPSMARRSPSENSAAKRLWASKISSNSAA